MKNKKTVWSWVIIIMIILLGGAWLIFKGGGVNKVQEVSTSSPIDIVSEFYDLWLTARNSEGSDPYTQGLADTPILSEALRDKLYGFEGKLDSEIDPVLCQPVVPSSFSVRTVYQSEEKSEILALSRDNGLEGQSVFNLKKHNDGWFIDDIKCAPGEFGPPREFTFEREGILIKDVEPPLNSQYWHLLFVENNEMSLVPLFFDGETTCIYSDGGENTCDQNQFSEGGKVTVYGNMDETGASLVKLKFSE